MKKNNIIYWICTILFLAVIGMGAAFDLVSAPEAIAIFKHLQYPAYLLPFLGAAKFLGIIAILTPGFPRLKEWAYAGFIFDITGALYSHINSSDGPSAWAPIIVLYVLITVSYILHHKRLKHRTQLRS